MAEQESVATVKFANQPKLFGKWDYDEVQVTDQCFKDYIAVQTSKSRVFVPPYCWKISKKEVQKGLMPNC
ncbi:unnamed protein product (macronuclear) [Paramecium tetraurelia]|uniref:RIN4 pathogenic type III effector avirulence factor Avr cleavage site domain-containing protein n=1 Tax=Paramecium tetraurelia TaxID=5888 RepID=A0CTM6_PARTE|nr:uncharacterized protein GSPATT00010377001 [Paramecium tetraurelia]CAK74143.1 unnamed protein product [Paramecium tetraurelia]|eukprot:XP_001441540.1 hypothetical protein (macronuclear) [Paramecium tetraurelia strain d4-2]